MDEIKQVTIYTDGGCDPNPGPGGWGAVLLFGAHRKEVSGGYRLSTNNRMELTAAIRALEALKEPCRVRLYSDSQYMVDAMTKGWAKSWKARGWKRSSKKKALNPDLWDQLLALCEKHQVEFKWVRGHAGTRENERCDQLAGQAREAKKLKVDKVYEKLAKEEGPAKLL